jgi:hypothetical protein
MQKTSTGLKPQTPFELQDQVQVGLGLHLEASSQDEV